MQSFLSSSQIGLRMSGYARVQILIVMSGTLLFLALVARYKLIGYEAVRPYHFLALCVAVFIAFVTAPRLLKAGVFKDKASIMVIALLSYVVVQGVLGDYRSAVDSIYIAANVMSFLAIFLYLRIWEHGIDALRVASLVVAMTTLACVGLAFLSWFILPPFSSSVVSVIINSASVFAPLKQSPAYLSRIHGIFGDPSVFGAFCAFSAILTIQMAWCNKSQSSRIYVLLLIAHLCAILGLMGSGSRMGIIAFGLMLTALAYYDFRKAMVVAGYCILMSPFFFGIYSLRNKWMEELLNVLSGASIPCTVAELSSCNEFLSHYVNESLRMNGVEQYQDRSDRMILAIGALQNSAPISLLFGCGAECAQKRGTLGLVGYLDLLQNYGLIFMIGLSYLFYITVRRIVLCQRSNAFISTNSIIIVGLLALEIFGYWIFAPFFNPIQLLFSYILAVAIGSSENFRVDMHNKI
jgi:hypothetical protein